MSSDNRQPRTVLMRGIEALSRREYSRVELARKLARTLSEDETSEELEAALDTLEQRGYLSNARYALGRVRVRAARYGNRRLAHELAMQGVSDEQVQQALEQVDDELSRARALWNKRFGRPPADRKERDKQVRFLASRGFGFDIISQVIRAETD